MEFCRVSVEAHRFGGTIYIAGLLADLAASRAEELIHGLSPETRVLRVDLRAVDLIDPDSFVRVARVLNRWRDARCGRVTIEFPHRSSRRKAERNLTLVGQLDTNGIAVSTAMT
jgi:ABC-type transporter Mla MlaB component